MKLGSNKNTYHILFGLLLLLFIGSKWNYLNLPYYWDEAWSYSLSFNHILEKGITLFPNKSLDPDITKGHPLFFYFFMCLGLKIFGNSFFVAHLINLGISVSVLGVIYKIVSKEFSQLNGLIAVSLICIQELFWVNSVMALPEISMALFVILALNALLKDEIWYYVLFASLAIMVKESALVLIISGLIYAGFIKQRFSFSLLVFKSILVSSIPLIVFGLFACANYYVYGWFFYPGHTGLLKFDFPTLLPKIDTSFFVMFVSSNRRFLSLLILAGIVYFILKKGKIKTIISDKRIQLLFVFIIGFLMFCSINVFISRYLLSTIFLLCIITSLVLTYLIKNRLIIFLMVAGLGVLNYFTSDELNNGYADEIEVTQKLVHYTNDSIPDENSSIYCSFLLCYYLQNPYMGYTNKVYRNLNQSFSAGETKYLLVTSNELAEKDEKHKNVSLKLIKRFTQKQAFAEIYLME